MPAAFPSIWNLPANPVFRRHAVARLRPLTLLMWVLVTQTLAGFGWALGFLLTIRVRSRDIDTWDFASPEFRGILTEHGLEAAVVGWLVVLFMQWIIVFVKGTFSVATGVAMETSEGMMDGQRLTPLPTGHKVVGQLAGLPVQENLIAALLALWAVPSVVFGGLPVLLVIKVNLIMLACVVLHHAIGLVAGMVIRNKTLAGTLSQVLVGVLNFGFPLAGYFGIGAISHLGASAAFLELLQDHLGDRTPFETQEAAVTWFSHPLPAAFYTWVIVVIAIGFLVIVIYRRWNDEHAQLLGKPGTLAFVATLLVVSWGEFHDFIPSLDWLDDRGAIQATFDGRGMSNAAVPAFIWIGGFTTALGFLNLLAATVLAPSSAQRMLHRHAPTPRQWHDGAPAIPWLLAICLLSSFAFHGISRPMLENEIGRASCRERV